MRISNLDVAIWGLTKRINVKRETASEDNVPSPNGKHGEPEMAQKLLLLAT
jgi:hypothetical protein